MSKKTRRVASTETLYGQSRSRGNQRQRGPRPHFRPTGQQLEKAEGLILRALKKGGLYASRGKDAVSALLKRFGRDAHDLGKTIQEKAATVHQKLLELIRDHRVKYDGYAFRLA